MNVRRLTLFLISLALPGTLLAEDTWRLEMELGAVWADHNDVQIPNDAQGDRFDIADFGRGPYPVARLGLAWRPWTRHEFQLVAAPLFYQEKGEFDQDVRFAGSTFRAGEATTIDYQFNSYRLRYLYHLLDGERWQLELGGTLFVRDAEIKLSQGDNRSSDSNVGLVPLLALKTSYAFAPHWRVVLDTDFAWAPQGRAIDLALLVSRQLSDHWDIAAGYRTIEGGADNDSVYTFAWFNAAVVNASFRW